MFCFSQPFSGLVPPALSLPTCPAPWPLQCRCSWGRDNLPSAQSSLPCLCSTAGGWQTGCLPPHCCSLLKGIVKQMAPCLYIINSKQMNKPVCQLGLCSVLLLANAGPFSWSLCSCWELTRERFAWRGPSPLFPNSGP